MKKKGSATSTLGIYIIEINIAISSRRFTSGELDVRVSNGSEQRFLCWRPTLITCHYPWG